MNSPNIRHSATSTKDLERADDHHAAIALLPHLRKDSQDDWEASSIDFAEHDPLHSFSATTASNGTTSRAWPERILHTFRGASSSGAEKSDSGSRPRLLTLLGHVLIFLLPSFLQSSLFPSPAGHLQRKPHATSYLDGLRGVAAAIVFLFHFTNNIYNQIPYAYGGPATEEYGENNSLFQLPIIKIIHSGPFAVSIFFVVSGFALSLKPLQLMRARDDAGLLASLSSAAFRRLIRLFLPCFISTFMVFLASRAGIFGANRFIADNKEILTGRLKAHIWQKGGFFEQLWDWFAQGLDMVKIFYWGKDEFQGFFSDYDGHLWTIPIEYCASMALFATHLALARFEPLIRMSCVFLLCVYAVNNDRWETLLFWGGMLLAELQQAEAISIRPPSAVRAKFRNAFMIANLVSGLYLGSYPDLGGEETPGYVFLSTLIPKNYSQPRQLWQGLGAIQIVLSVSSMPPLSRLFASTIPYYLGQISFALYLMHGLVNQTAGYWLLYWMYQATGRWETPMKKALGFVLALAINTVVLIWVSDVFWRFGERPCVRFARWLEGKCMRTTSRPVR